jgi:hypothetical protein
MSALKMNDGTDPLWQAQDMDSENFRGARLIPKTEIEIEPRITNYPENRNRTTDPTSPRLRRTGGTDGHGLRKSYGNDFYFGVRGESSLAPLATWRFKFFSGLVAEWFANSKFP